MSKSLTIGQRIDYNERLKRLKGWVGDSLARAEDLKVIRDRRLYQDDYKTFESFVEGEFGIGRGRAYQLLDAQEVRESLGEMSTMVDTERAARELKKVPPKKRKAVVKAAAATGKVTAKSIVAAAKSVDGKAEIVEERDASGYPVPAPSLEIWSRRDEAKKHVDLISAARCAVRDLIAEQESLKAQDMLYAEVNLKSVLAALNNAYTEMNLSVPRMVCGICQGQAPKTCACCKGRGVISKNKWDLCIPVEIKQMRKGH